ncbi:hypothetical protein HN971_00420 [archaeon]|jgi:hypothetical protein|nr:hypothetical protein [archaeon]
MQTTKPHSNWGVNERKMVMTRSDEKSGGNVFSWVWDIWKLGPSFGRFVVLLIFVAYTVGEVQSIAQLWESVGLGTTLNLGTRGNVSHLPIIPALFKGCLFVVLTTMSLAWWIKRGNLLPFSRQDGLLFTMATWLWIAAMCGGVIGIFGGIFGWIICGGWVSPLIMFIAFTTVVTIVVFLIGVITGLCWELSRR